MNNKNITQTYNNKKELINNFLETQLPNNKNNELLNTLCESIRYSVLGSGKRLRAILSLIFSEINGIIDDGCLKCASSLEIFHAYSLVHDDLPAMDNDDLRRGKPTVHKKYGEALAILCGDALLTLGFNWLSTCSYNKNTNSKLIENISEAIGYNGMVGGQYIDMYGIEKIQNNELNDLNEESLLNQIHINKTAKLIAISCETGSIYSNASLEMRKKAYDFGLKLGMAFQITDDILDETSTAEELGKTPGKDEKQNKLTSVKIYGLSEAKKIALDYTNEAMEIAESLKNDELKNLCNKLINRTY